MIDHDPPAGPIIQRISVYEGGRTPSEPLAEDARGDAPDRSWAGMPAAWPIVAISGRRAGSMVGPWSQCPDACRWLLMAAAALSVLALGCWLPKPYRLIYNASGSVPIGFYRTNGRHVARRGSLMLVALPEPWRRLAARRGYLPFGVLALKRVVGGPGDMLCGYGERVFLNGRLVATRARHDALGRAMPTWSGCTRLAHDRWCIVNPAPRSFDSRYIGPVPTTALRAEVVAL